MVSSLKRDVARDVDVVSTGAALGAEIRGVDLRHLDALQFAALERAWHDHQVILLRGQTLSDQDLIAFSRRFGDLDWAPVQETGRRFVEGLPEIYIVSNVTVNGQPIGSFGAGEAVWHTDMSYLDVPPMASMLYALEVPPAGGNTSFCSMYAVYEALPDQLKRRIANLKIKHDGTYNSGGYLRQGVAATDDPRKSPGAVHPLVCTHPDTGRRMLYLGRRRNAYLMGLELAGLRGAARRVVGLRRAPRVRLGARLAGRRPGAVGQPLHDASARPLRRLGAPHHAPNADQGRRKSGLMRRFSVSNTVLLIICLMYLILYVDRVNISTAAPLIKADLGLSNTQLGLVFSAFAYPYALFQLIGGYFAGYFWDFRSNCFGFEVGFGA